ncbi:hypothetical protein A8C32_01150 [Flavivirga aquatica]|uniref:Adhesin domain-containing protein n=1 Tax=Flavivirga aquatica TaxID=1849968 RepID=A0A1E5T9M5_9FLAO|nr:hypothetical protein [Flavivirga aquatica]OEK08095.1 hypothetical protein A8C32_01150 [Flavivirga aquatica]
MNKIIIKIKLFTIYFLITGTLIAQEKLTKVSQSIKVNKDVTIDLNTSYCNIIFDTWNKDVVEVEAYIEGSQLSRETLKKALKLWKVDIDASQSEISIETSKEKGIPVVWAYKYKINSGEDEKCSVLEELKFELADIPEIPELPELPNLPELPEMPELPPLPNGINEIQFDYEAYKKDGEKYLEKYTQKFESKFGDNYSKKMEAWSDEFEKKWAEKYGEEMEKWSERLTEKMERKAEERIKLEEKRREVEVKRLESQAKRLQYEHERHEQERVKLLKKRQKEIEILMDKESNFNIKKTIKIKMPKRTKLKVNVRHGEIEFASNINNLKANLSHTKLTAYSINGSGTSINASYSPIYIANWNLGELNLHYVKNAELGRVKHLVLNATSSNVSIDDLLGNTIIDGNIGDLKISNIDDTFTSLNVILQNSNAIIKLPRVDCNLQYKGTRSCLDHPKKNLKNNTSSFSLGNLASGKSIIVNAKYSSIEMK